MTSSSWSWLSTASSPRSQYKSSLPFLPSITKNRQAEHFREKLQTGNSEYGSFWGSDFALRHFHRNQPDYVMTPPSRDWRGGVLWTGDQYDQYLNSVYRSLQGGRGERGGYHGGHQGHHGLYHFDCDVCNPPRLSRDAYAGFEEDPLMRAHKINMFNLGQALTDLHLPAISPTGAQYGYR